MALMPLLPRTKGQEWPAQTTPGLHTIPDVDYQRNLCESYYEVSDYGTPSPLAYPRVFGERLETYLRDLRDELPRPRFAEVFTHWSLLIQGLFFDLIAVEPIANDALGDLGQVLAAELPDDYRVGLLRFDGEAIGLTDPRVGAVLGARVGGETLDRLRTRLNEEAETLQAQSYFAGWTRRHILDHGLRHLFDGLLDRLGRRVAGREPQALTDDDLKVLDSGTTLILGDGHGESLAVELPRYTGTPVICGNCHHEIGKDLGKDLYEVREPEDCCCKECLAPQDWLDPHTEWLRFDPERGEYLIYALTGSPIHDEDYPFPVELQSDGVEIVNGQLRLKVVGTVISEARLRCNRLTFFVDGDRDPVRPTLPVRGDYFGLVDPAVDRAQRTSDGTFIVPLRVKGWEEQIYLRYEKEEIQEQEEALLLVWPRFRLAGWGVYFFLFEVQPRLREAGITLRLLRRGEPPEALTHGKTRGMVEAPFDAFEVVFAREGSEMEYAGIFEPSWIPAERGEALATLAVDFGTSATTVWYRIGEKDPQPLRFADYTATVIGNRHFSDRMLDKSFWLPSYRIDDRRTALGFYNRELGDGAASVSGDEVVAKMNYFVPAELVVRTPAGRHKGLGEPIYEFGICHPYGARVDAEVLYELKSLPPEGESDGRFSFVELVSRYLELVLLGALASIVQQEQRVGVLKIRTAFPRAFSGEKLGMYVKAFEQARDWIAERTGFRTSELLLLDESRAAAQAMPAPGEMVLVMDLGGGTSDIGIFEYQEGVLEPLLIDSLQYGGNDFLRLLVKEEHLFPKPSEREENRLLWLFREIRLRGFGEVVRTHYTADKTARDQAIKLLLRFFEPLAYFVHRLFEALPELYPQKDLAGRPVTVYLVGNGWSLAEAIPVADSSLGSEYRAILQGVLEEQGLTNLTVPGKPRPSAAELDWPGPKAAVAYGALMARVDDLWRSTEEAGANGNGVRSIVGFDIAIDDGSNNKTQVAWSAPIPLPVPSDLCKPLLGNIELPAAWKRFITFEKGDQVIHLQRVCAEDIPKNGRKELTRSVLTRFIEKVYLDQLAKGV